MPAPLSRPRLTPELLHALLAQGEANPTQEALAQISGMSTRTVASALASLRAEGLVHDSSTRLGPAWGHVLGIAVGMGSCRAALVDANGAVHHEEKLDSIPDQLKLEPAELLERIAQVGRAVLARARKDTDLTVNGSLPLLGVATAWPCPVRGSKRASGLVMNAAWQKPDAPTLTAAVANVLDVPEDRSHALNDANAHALAVAFDKARALADREDQTYRIALLLRLGGGIGAATMIHAPHRRSRLSFLDSALIEGARHMAGELGHLPIHPARVEALNTAGRLAEGLAPLSMDWRCSCGETGHLEALASGTAFARRMESSGLDAEDVVDSLRTWEANAGDDAPWDVEDQRVLYALEDIGRLIGGSLASPILLLDPHSITLTGSFAVAPVISGLMGVRETWRPVFGDALKLEALGAEASRYIGVRGAALAVLRAQVYRRFEQLLEAPATLLRA